MNEAAKLIGGTIIGADFEFVRINGKRYVLYPPTIFRIAGASYYLADIPDGKSVKEIIERLSSVENAAKALSWFLVGNDSLYEELSQGTFVEVIDALEVAFRMISAKNFLRLSALAKSVGSLTAKPKL